MAKRKSLLKNFYPKYTFEKVEDIPYELIKKDGIKLILMDMDNTLIDNRKEYSKNLKKWIKDIKSKGVILYIVSNSFSTKIVKRISKELGVRYYYKATKPRRKGFKAVCEQFPDISKSEIMMVGDQLFTDVVGARRMKMFSILVKQVDKKDLWYTAWKRPLERRLLKKYLEKKGKV